MTSPTGAYPWHDGHANGEGASHHQMRMGETTLLDVTTLLIDAMVDRLTATYHRTYGSQDAAVPEIVAWAAELAIENIGRSDALYHDIEHTIMVTLCGAEILRCRHLVEGGVTTRDWLHVVVSLLCHDIGYVRGVCRGDVAGAWRTGCGDTVALPPGATDAALQPWHVDRGMQFVRERFAGNEILDVDVIIANIDYTRFPVTDDEGYHETTSYRAICRAADLVGQLADPYYLAKLPALYKEMEETGLHERLGYKDPSEMRARFPDFYARAVHPWVEASLRYLNVTAEGRRWIANLHDHVHRAGLFNPDEPS